MMPPIINQPARAHLWQLWNSSLLLMLFPWTQQLSHSLSSSPWKALSKITRMIFVTITLGNNHADQAHHNHGQYLHFHHDQRHCHDLLFPDLPPDCLTLQLWRDAKEVEKGLPPTKVIMMVPRWWWWYQDDHDGTKVVVEDVSRLMGKKNQSPYSLH